MPVGLVSSLGEFAASPSRLNLHGVATTGSEDPEYKGGESYIRGYFTKFVASSEAYTYSEDALDLGARIVKLTK